MAEKLELSIVTPAGTALKVSAEMVTLPGIDGEFGLLPGARPTLCALGIGVLTYQNGADTKKCAVRGGFAEGSGDKVSVLTDEYIESTSVDPVLVRTELKEAEKDFERLQSKAERDVSADEEKQVVGKLNWLATQLDLYGEPATAVVRTLEGKRRQADDEVTPEEAESTEKAAER
jgi:F-type H+-transporting ATPase subunit epsilon